LRFDGGLWWLQAWQLGQQRIGANLIGNQNGKIFDVFDKVNLRPDTGEPP